MMKRKNPFDEVPILRKMHISAKEVDLGVNAQENMKKVYDKTHNLLFYGATKNQNCNPELSRHPLNKPSPEEQKGVGKLCCQSNMKSSCSFCEKIVCVRCARLCYSCNFEFCQLCSILQYSAQEEYAVCLSCL
ncbi:apoptosis regulatory protein Siva-like [Uloborus diversus]|uniref:apoptosis regulatory protein Siva-like n=1 Tax=Uloborus diversus TaxID=327109 RepID=UPI002409620D|nr:apoptosis regulatory protein Siva-like [Uloborus diversus]